MKKLSVKKKWIIILGTLLALVGLIVLLSFTAFSLKSVEVDYRTSTSFISASDKEIIKSGNFKMGASVFFHGKSYYKKQIERANPYIKVINIETVFPSKFVIHIAERQEVYAIKAAGGFYICDENLLVLRWAGEDEYSADSMPYIVQPEEEIDPTYSVGEHIKLAHKPNIYTYLFENNRPLGQQRGLIERVELTSEYDEVLDKDLPLTVVKMNDGHVFKIYNDGYGMRYKVKMMLDVFSQMYDFVGKTVKIEGEEVVLTLEDVQNCSFKIANYYNYTTHSEKDCYFDICLTLDGKHS